MVQSHAAWEKRVRVLVESLVASDSDLGRWDVLDFLTAGEHGLAIETLADWIGDLEDPALVSPGDRARVLDLVSDFPEETRTRVRRALTDAAESRLSTHLMPSSETRTQTRTQTRTRAPVDAVRAAPVADNGAETAQES
ncbi:hypothetical protein [Streptomyces sp. FIT100]|uniref:hypothetical protein n=1 Tax=Streptomyces sp. FIT100 TaxID=2837956 RepID=UPI0021C98B64|nr:hypothetical protein [Streptomyces sp. FIT100]UUN31622.1 hypothetical protein KK483_25655 [Streptomyces sp. FIT100]